MQQQLTKQNALKQQAEVRLLQAQEKRQAEQQIAEEDRLRQEAEQHRLASLSPIDQEIETFLTKPWLWHELCQLRHCHGCSDPTHPKDIQGRTQHCQVPQGFTSDRPGLVTFTMVPQ